VEASSPLFESPPEKRGRKATTVTGKGGKVRKDKSFEIAPRNTTEINSALSDQVDMSHRHRLKCNQKPKRCFQGKIPGYDGFMLDESLARKLRGDSGQVISPYLTGRELLDEFVVDRWCIDFQKRDMLEAQRFAAAFRHCQMHVLPRVQESLDEAKKDKSDMVDARAEHLDRWWQFWNRRDELSDWLSRNDRCVACSRVTRRPVMVFLSTEFCPSDLIQVFALQDDYSFGILQSTPHFEWFKTSSRLKVESDTRYSVRDVFETFAWPQGVKFTGPTNRQIMAVAEAGREVRRIRASALPTLKGGLRALYRTLELDGKNPLKDAHAALDAAVLDAYGFEAKQDLLKQLLDLNLAVAKRIERGEEVVPPGVPPSFDDVPSLVTDDCVRPQ